MYGQLGTTSLVFASESKLNAVESIHPYTLGVIHAKGRLISAVGLYSIYSGSVHPTSWIISQGGNQVAPEYATFPKLGFGNSHIISKSPHGRTSPVIITLPSVPPHSDPARPSPYESFIINSNPVTVTHIL